MRVSEPRDYRKSSVALRLQERIHFLCVVIQETYFLHLYMSKCHSAEFVSSVLQGSLRNIWLLRGQQLDPFHKLDGANVFLADTSSGQEGDSWCWQWLLVFSISDKLLHDCRTQVVQFCYTRWTKEKGDCIKLHYFACIEFRTLLDKHTVFIQVWSKFIFYSTCVLHKQRWPRMNPQQHCSKSRFTCVWKWNQSLFSLGHVPACLKV